MDDRLREAIDALILADWDDEFRHGVRSFRDPDPAPGILASATVHEIYQAVRGATVEVPARCEVCGATWARVRADLPTPTPPREPDAAAAVFGVPVFVNDTVPPGEIRVFWPDGRIETIKETYDGRHHDHDHCR